MNYENLGTQEKANLLASIAPLYHRDSVGFFTDEHNKNLDKQVAAILGYEYVPKVEPITNIIAPKAMEDVAIMKKMLHECAELSEKIKATFNAL